MNNPVKFDSEGNVSSLTINVADVPVRAQKAFLLLLKEETFNQEHLAHVREVFERKALALVREQETLILKRAARLDYHETRAAIAALEEEIEGSVLR